MELPVSIKTNNRAIIDIVSRIEKTFHLEMWINKAESLFYAYMECLDSLKTILDKNEIGVRIQECESYNISCVTYIMRCFVDQPSSHLEIEDCTSDPKLIGSFLKLKRLRDDEYVHWKGINSNIRVFFSLKILGGNQVEFGESCHVNYDETFGPWDENENIKELIATIRNQIIENRRKHLNTLRKYLMKEETYDDTEIIDENGKVVFSKSVHS